jgi:type IV pilus assembly protein PilP
MRRLHLTALVAALAFGAAACSEAKKPPARPVAPPAVAPAMALPKADAKPDAAEPERAYSSVGKRDPFRSFLAELAESREGAASRCRTPLGRFEIDQLKLVAVVTGLDDPVAMVQAPNGVGYSIRRGACVGRNGGVISAVRSGEVLIQEWAIRADGTRDRTQTIMKLPREASLNIEE